MTRRNSDYRLVEAAVAGDSKAFDELVTRYQRAVYAMAFAIVADREAALDVLQESFIAAYKQMESLDDSNHFGPWICGIARNQAKRLRRVRHRYFSRELPLPETEIASQQSQANILLERTHDALASLTPMQANAVTLYYMEGYSIAECAGLLEVPQGTIKRRLHDARQRLKKEMADMVEKHLKDFALPEDYRVVIDKPTKIHTTRPALAYFKDRWIIIWQDGVPWEPYDGPFWFWLAESSDGKNWSEPRKLEIPKGCDAMRYNPDYLQLMSVCVLGDRLVFVTQQFAGHADMYSSEDTINWTVHPRFRMGIIGRPSLFSSGNDLYMIYPSGIPDCGYRVDIIRSSDGGFSWTWLNSPYWGDGHIYDVAGVVIGGKIYVAWREILGKWIPTGEVSGEVHWRRHVTAVEDEDVQEGELTQRVWMGKSDDGGQTWDHRVWKPQEYPGNSGLTIFPLPEKPEPQLIEVLDISKPFYSNSLKLASFNDVMALAQEVRKADCAIDVWVALSNDGGKTWPEKAIYSDNALSEPAIAFAPDGTLVLAGSSRTGSKARPWVVHSRVEI